MFLLFLFCSQSSVLLFLTFLNETKKGNNVIKRTTLEFIKSELYFTLVCLIKITNEKQMRLFVPLPDIIGHYSPLK